MPLANYSAQTALEDIIQVRAQDVITIDALELGKLQGRIRTDFRAAPSSATDVVAGDDEGDVVVDSTYIYTLLSVSNTLKWHRVTLSVSW